MLQLVAVAALALLAAPTPAAPFALHGDAGRTVALVARDGTKTKLSEVAAPVTVIAVWSTGCGPCIEDLPDLDQLARNYNKKDVAIMAVAIDPTEKLADVNALVEKLHLKLPIYLGDYQDLVIIGEPPTAQKTRHLLQIPLTLVIDAKLKTYRMLGSGQDSLLPRLIKQAREGKLPDSPPPPSFLKKAPLSVPEESLTSHPD